MKICILTERMKLGFGVDLVVDEQAKRLARRGFDVTVAVIHADMDQPARDYRLVIINRIIFQPDYGSEKSMRHILEKCGVSDTDVWMVHTAPFYEWIRWLSGPIIVTEYGTPPGKHFRRDIGQSIDDYIDTRVNRLYPHLQQFDKIVSISKSLHDWLPKPAQELSSVSYIGCDHHPTPSKASVLRLRAELGVGDKDCLLLWVGRMQLTDDEQPYKGFQELLDIAPKIMARAPRCTFVLAGRVEDDVRAELESRGFKVRGNLSSEELAITFAAADLLINLSKWEGFNLALPEAQIQGTPVVAYDFGPHSEVVLHGKTGFLASDVEGIIEAAVKVATDVKLRNRLSTEARVFARRFNWENNVDQLVETIETCIQKAPPRAQIDIIRKAHLTRLSENAVVPPGKEGNFDWPTIDSREFVRMAFKVLLGREAEPEAVAGYSALIDSGYSRWAVLAEIRFSEEGASRPLHDPVLVSLIANEPAFIHQNFATMRIRNPDLGIGDARRAIEALASTIRHNDIKVDSIKSELLNNINAMSETLSSSSVVDHYDVAGLDATLNSMSRDYTILVAMGACINRNILTRALAKIDGRPGDVIYGDELELLSNGQSQLIVNGPICVENFVGAPNLGGCILVRTKLLDDLGLARSSVLTSALIVRVLEHACAITYVPMAFSERRSDMPDAASVTGTHGRGNAGVDDINIMPHALAAHPEQQSTQNVDLAGLAIVVTVGTTSPDDDWRDAVARFGPEYGKVIVFAHERECEGVIAKVNDAQASNVVVKIILEKANVAKLINDAIRALPSSIDKIACVERSHAPSFGKVARNLSLTAARNDVGVISPMVVDHHGRILNIGLAARKEWLFAYIGRYCLPDRITDIGAPSLHLLRHVTAVSGGIMMFRRSVFDLLRGFDETLGPAAANIDFSLRARSYGLVVMSDGRCVVTASDTIPQWGVDFRADDVLTLLVRHPSWINRPDEFSVERGVDGVPVSIYSVTKHVPRTTLQMHGSCAGQRSA